MKTFFYAILFVIAFVLLCGASEAQDESAIMAAVPVFLGVGLLILKDEKEKEGKR